MPAVPWSPTHLVNGTALEPIDLSCPACGRRPVKCLQPSIRGAYCECLSCHHLWQQDGLAATRRTPPLGARRRLGDRAGGARDSQTSSICGYCGLDDEAGHVCPTDLLKRRILELEAENAHLRESALSFGDLAERLNQRMSDAAKRERPGNGLGAKRDRHAD